MFIRTLSPAARRLMGFFIVLSAFCLLGVMLERAGHQALVQRLFVDDLPTTLRTLGHVLWQWVLQHDTVLYASLAALWTVRTLRLRSRGFDTLDPRDFTCYPALAALLWLYVTVTSSARVDSLAAQFSLYASIAALAWLPFFHVCEMFKAPLDDDDDGVLVVAGFAFVMSSIVITVGMVCYTIFKQGEFAGFLHGIALLAALIFAVRMASDGTKAFSPMRPPAPTALAPQPSASAPALAQGIPETRN